MTTTIRVAPMVHTAALYMLQLVWSRPTLTGDIATDISDYVRSFGSTK